MTEEQARAAGLTEEQIAALHLSAGSHSSPEGGMCLLEAVSVDAGEPFSDKPKTTDPVLGAFGRSWNDRISDDERQTLKKYIPMLRNTYKGPKLQIARAFIALDWMTRTHLPMWLEKVPELAEHAATLRALAPITAELGEAERTDAIDKINVAARAAWDARAAWAAWAARDALDALDARAARDARAAWAARDARAAWDALDARAARDARAAWDALDARAARDALDARAAWAAWAARAARDAWDARDAWAARAARDAWDARDVWDTWDARDAWDAAAAAAQTAAFEAAKGCATYEEARAKADAVFMAHRDEVQAQLHGLYTRMINAKLQEAAEIDKADSE